MRKIAMEKYYGSEGPNGREKEPAQEFNSPNCVGGMQGAGRTGRTGRTGGVGGVGAVGVGDQGRGGAVGQSRQSANGGTRTESGAGVKGEIAMLVERFSDGEARAALAMLQAMASVSRGS